MKVYTFKRNNDFNFKIKDTCVSIPCHSQTMTRKARNKETNSMNKDIMPLDSRIKYENDNIESSSCHSGLRAGIQRGDNLMPKAFRFAQSGRSMVEMLGTLAVMGVLSIGGIMGYSYAVDKYHANQIMNDVNLRAIDLIAQASRGGDFSLAEWQTKTSSDLDIGLEVDEATNTSEGGIYVKDVEKDICEIIADDLLPEDVELVIDGEAYTSGNCGETNKMVFYYDAINSVQNRLPNTQKCGFNKVFDDVSNQCVCANAGQYLYNGKCVSCNIFMNNQIYIGSDGYSCNCSFTDIERWEICLDNLHTTSECDVSETNDCQECDSDKIWHSELKKCICRNRSQYLSGDVCVDCENEFARQTPDGSACSCSIWADILQKYPSNTELASQYDDCIYMEEELFGG